MRAVLRLQLRRLRSEALPGLTLAGLVFVTTLLLAVGPRMLERISNQSLAGELGAAPAAQRDIVITELSRPTADVPTTAADTQARLDVLSQQFPPELNALISNRSYVVDSTSWDVESGTQFMSILDLRLQQGIEDHVTLVDGRLPNGHVIRRIVDPITAERAVVYEVMLPESAAKEMGVSVGQELPLNLSHFDPRNRGIGAHAAVKVVGTYRPTDPNDEFWLNDKLATDFRFRDEGDLTIVESDAIIHPDAYEALEGVVHDEGLPLSFQWRFGVDVSRIDATRAGELETTLRRFENQRPRSGVSDVPANTTMREGLLGLLLAHEARWTSAAALLGVVGMGALFVAAACLALVALLASNGRRRTAALALARGARMRTVRLSLVAESLFISLPAAALALGLAALIEPAASWAVSVGAAVLAVLTMTALVTVLGVPAGGAAAARRGGESVLPRAVRLTPRQLVIEGAVVVGAIISAIVLRERGLNAAASGSTLGADPLMVAVPALVGIAAGILALRLYPFITSQVSRLSTFTTGMVFALATRRAARGRSAAAVLLTLIATASVAGFAVAGWKTLDGAAQAIGWQLVGAPYRVSTDPTQTLPAGFDASAVPGVTAVAPASTRDGVIAAQHALLVGLDAPTYDAITRNTPGNVPIPAEMIEPLPAGADALPAIASTSSELQVGARGVYSLGFDSVTFNVVKVIDAFPLGDPGDRFLIVAQAQLATLTPALGGAPSADFIDAPPSSANALKAAASSQPNLQFASQQEAAATLAATPVSQAVSVGLAAAALAAALYAALAVAAAFVLAAADQRAETAYLHVLGLTRGQRLRLIFAEHVPAAVVAAIVGGVLGVLVFGFVRPALGLPAILPETADINLSFDLGQLLALLLAALLIVIPAWALAAFAQREANPAAAVREGGT